MTDRRADFSKILMLLYSDSPCYRLHQVINDCLNLVYLWTYFVCNRYRGLSSLNLVYKALVQDRDVIHSREGLLR